MTKEEILAMVPGPDLNILVGEKVMGYNFLSKFFGMVVFELPDGGERRSFSPSSDISAAWEVGEKFESFQVTKMFLNGESDKYKAIVKANHHRAYAASAAEAICKAALLAVMTEEVTHEATRD